MPYNFDTKLPTKNWTVEIDNNENYGCFEHNKTGVGGGLWFDEDKVLIDYDGVFELPEEVKSTLKEHGYGIEEDEND